jgi:hypothetical protein
MLQPEFLDNRRAWHGEISGPETWWVARQEALEHTGYMLRPRYRPGWKPSWVGTDKDAFDSEDGQSHSVSAYSFALGIRAHNFQVARVHGRNSDLWRKTHDVEKAPHRRGSL